MKSGVIKRFIVNVLVYPVWLLTKCKGLKEWTGNWKEMILGWSKDNISRTEACQPSTKRTGTTEKHRHSPEDYTKILTAQYDEGKWKTSIQLGVIMNIPCLDSFF